MQAVFKPTLEHGPELSPPVGLELSRLGENVAELGYPDFKSFGNDIGFGGDGVGASRLPLLFSFLTFFRFFSFFPFFIYRCVGLVSALCRSSLNSGYLQIVTIVPLVSLLSSIMCPFSSFLKIVRVAL